MRTITPEPATFGQIRQLTDVGCRSIERLLIDMGLSGEDAQRVLERGGRFASAIREAALSSIYKLSNFKEPSDSELAYALAYPDGYGVKPIDSQVYAISEAFDLNPKPALAYSRHLPELPEGAEGWFAIPRQGAVAGTYEGVVGLIFSKLGRNRSFYNYRLGKLSPEYLRRSTVATNLEQRLEEAQGGDILLIPAQFGLRHSMYGSMRTREMFVDREFGLGVFATGAMLLTHPEREQTEHQLHVSCPGDYYCPYPEEDTRALATPGFRCENNGRMYFTSSSSLFLQRGTGQVSAFLP